MKEYVLDANAVVRYFQGGKENGSEKIQAILERAQEGRARLLMSVVNLGEVVYVLLKAVSEQTVADYVKTLQHAISMAGVDLDLAMRAATLKHRYKLGYADSFAAALALSRRATLISADPEFRKLEPQLKLLKLPAYR